MSHWSKEPRLLSPTPLSLVGQKRFVGLPCLIVACVAIVLFSAPQRATAAGPEGTYRIVNLSNNKMWHWDARDQLVSTRLQPNDDSTRFVIKANPEYDFSISTLAGKKKLNCCKEFKWFPGEQSKPNPNDERLSTLPPKRADWIAKRYPNDINEEIFRIGGRDDGAFYVNCVGTRLWSKRADGIIAQCGPTVKVDDAYKLPAVAAELEEFSWFMLIDKDALPNQAAEVEVANNSSTPISVMKTIWSPKQKIWTQEFLQEIGPVTSVSLPAKVAMRLTFWNTKTKDRLATLAVAKPAETMVFDDQGLKEVKTRLEAERLARAEAEKGPVKLFDTTYTVPQNIWSARWTFKKNPSDDHEGLLEADYGLMESKKLTFVPIKDDPTVQITGSQGGKLRTFQEVQFEAPMALNKDGDDRNQTAKDATDTTKKGKRNISTLKLRANVEIIGDSRTITLNDVSAFVNSNFKGPTSEGGSKQSVGWFLEKVVIKMSIPSKSWRTPVFGPATANNQVGYNFTDTKGANMDVSKMGPSVGLNASQSSGASASINDYKYVSTYAPDGRSPVFTWTLGNVYDGDDKPTTYKNYTSAIHFTSISGAVDHVLDVAPLAKATFIPTCFAGWTVRAEDVSEDLKCRVDYELTYRDITLTKEQNGAKRTGIAVAKGLAFFMCKDFYNDPKGYLMNKKTSYLSVKLVQKLSVHVTVPKEQIVSPYAPAP